MKLKYKFCTHYACKLQSDNITIVHPEQTQGNHPTNQTRKEKHELNRKYLVNKYWMSSLKKKKKKVYTFCKLDYWPIQPFFFLFFLHGEVWGK